MRALCILLTGLMLAAPVRAQDFDGDKDRIQGFIMGVMAAFMIDELEVPEALMECTIEGMIGLNDFNADGVPDADPTADSSPFEKVEYHYYACKSALPALGEADKK